MKVSVESVDNEKLTVSQREMLGAQANSAFVVDVNISVSGNDTKTFGNGKIHVYVSYTLKSSEDVDSITVWFINSDGTIEPKNGRYKDGFVEFADYDTISKYAFNALGWTVNAGLMQGSDNNLMPSGSATRAQVAAILQRFCQNIVK